MLVHQSMLLKSPLQMGRKADVSEILRSQILLLHEDGYRQNAIANRLSVSCATVHRVVHGVKPKIRRGPMRKTTCRDDLLLKRLVNSNPFITSTQAKASLPSMSDVSTRTIRRRLQIDLNLPARMPSKKPLMPATAVKRRLTFCRKYAHWTQDDWAKVLFSDESIFRQFNNVRGYVRRPPGSNPNNPRFVTTTVKHCPQVMVWGCFSAEGRGGLYFVPKGESMNSQRYLNVLNDKLPLWMDILSCNTFQQDSAPCHKSKSVTSWFRTNQIEVLDWPSYSPDLNPIENLWAIIKEKVSKVQIKSLSHLGEVIKNVWCSEIDAQLCKNLVFSMPTRIQKVLKNKGHATKY